MTFEEWWSKHQKAQEAAFWKGNILALTKEAGEGEG